MNQCGKSTAELSQGIAGDSVGVVMHRLREVFAWSDVCVVVDGIWSDDARHELRDGHNNV